MMGYPEFPVLDGSLDAVLPRLRRSILRLLLAEISKLAELAEQIGETDPDCELQHYGKLVDAAIDVLRARKALAAVRLSGIGSAPISSAVGVKPENMGHR